MFKVNNKNTRTMFWLLNLNINLFLGIYQLLRVNYFYKKSSVINVWQGLKQAHECLYYTTESYCSVSFSHCCYHPIHMYLVPAHFSANHRTEGEGGGHSFNSSVQLHPLHRQLDISRAITAESSPLHIGSSRTWNGNL